MYTYAENNPVNFADPSGHGSQAGQKQRLAVQKSSDQRGHQGEDLGRQYGQQGKNRGEQSSEQGKNHGEQCGEQGQNRSEQSKDHGEQCVQQGEDHGEQCVQQGEDHGEQRPHQSKNHNKQHVHQSENHGKQCVQQSKDLGPKHRGKNPAQLGQIQTERSRQHPELLDRLRGEDRKTLLRQNRVKGRRGGICQKHRLEKSCRRGRSPMAFTGVVLLSSGSAAPVLLSAAIGSGSGAVFNGVLTAMNGGSIADIAESASDGFMWGGIGGSLRGKHHCPALNYNRIQPGQFNSRILCLKLPVDFLHILHYA